MNAAHSALRAEIPMNEIDDLLQSWIDSGRRVVHEADSKRILDMAGLPVPGRPAQSSAVVKFCADNMLHKSELDLVALNVPLEKVPEHQDLVQKRARSAGLSEGVVLVEAMIEGALMEWFVGCRNDHTFGPVIAIGAGGIYAEFLGVPEIRMAPLSRREAEQALRSHKAFPIINGARGKEPADIPAFARLISEISDFFYRRSHLIAELDLNPVMVRSRSTRPNLVIADASIILQKPAG